MAAGHAPVEAMSKKPLEARRLAIEALIARERTQKDVAEEFGVTRQAVAAWVRKFRESGKITGTFERTKGKKVHISPADVAALRAIVTTQAPADHRIESADAHWRWQDLQDLVFMKHNRRAARSQCVNWLDDWGVPDPDAPRGSRRPRRNEIIRPVSSDESQELSSLLEAYQARQDETESPEDNEPAREPRMGPPDKTKSVRRKKEKEKRRQSNKRARAQKRKQRQKRR